MPFEDKTMCSDCLVSQKFVACAYNTAITECANDSLRRDFMSIYQDEQSHLKNIWNIMYSKGWYQVNMATDQEVSQLQQRMQQEYGQAQQMMAGMGPRGPQGGPQPRV